ncbi:ABC transporter substrate-binding protein [Rugamonas brunnea]|uniref:ABC transporter substrate-binding protein n=1 Tax=Rugamonas brunnea TaxID=2758569 RepID=UPI002882FBE6|nr:ABC transporter substrate binding protein [Rugamonas brunnea]
MPAAGRLLAGAFALATLATPAVHADTVPDNGGTRSLHGEQLAQAADTARRPRVAAGTLAVLYPDIGEPYRKVFTEILEGIEDQTQSRVHGYPVAASADPAELQATLKNSGCRVVIALGRQGLKTASGLDLPLGMVVGGVSSVPEADKLNGISLTPDPALLFTHLKNLMPGVRRVIVVYNPHTNEPLMKLARETARAQGLELLTLEATDLAGAVRRYESALASADGRRDAFWLPPDPLTVDEGVIMPMLLRESWNRNIAIFSSSILHVRKGALFALYPNNFELGRDLATLALARLNGDTARRGVAPLRAVRTALNTRSASHMGLNISTSQQRSFDAIFPEP